MEWILVPIILIAITILICWLSQIINNWVGGMLTIFAILLGIVSFFMCFFAPASYYTGLQDSIVWTAYYDNMITPNIIRENDNSVVINNNNAAIWQIADRRNINSYNTYLASNRYWDNIPIMGWMVYSAPSKLRYVQISK